MTARQRVAARYNAAMADWFLHTGLYLLGVVLIPGVGLLLVCWGLWGDRSKNAMSPADVPQAEPE